MNFFDSLKPYKDLIYSFRQYLNELIYVVQNQSINRRIAIEEEEDKTVRIYLINLKKNFEALIISSKPKILTETQLMAIGI